MDKLPPFLVFLVCYVIGSFPTAYLAGRLNRINIFEVGSETWERTTSPVRLA
jgi:glycerol-3-phosphate acyltransferase PlsY